MVKTSKKESCLIINVASPSRIKNWCTRSYLPEKNFGEVYQSFSTHYGSDQPVFGGIFCERIFGPIKTGQCSCRRIKKARTLEMSREKFCPICKVEHVSSIVRRYRMGYIDLQSPVMHFWFLDYISILVNLNKTEVKKLVYFYALLESESQKDFSDHRLSNTRLAYKMGISENYKNIHLEKPTGAEIIHKMLSNINLKQESGKLIRNLRFLKTNVTKSIDFDRQLKITRKLRLINYFLKTRSRPEWMLIKILPVLPPSLRPILITAKGLIMSSDLNRHYISVLTRNNRLKCLYQMAAPYILIKREKRLLQQAVDNVIDNEKCDHPRVHRKGKTESNLTSLSSILRGKKGIFRQNLLATRVDFSGRSVIIVGPTLKLHECGLPKEMALELFQPFVISKLISLRQANSVRSAKKLILLKNKIVYKILENVLKGHPILLNRAPTLHRLGIQAFQPKISSGQAIELHPLVCSAFNADFDGDQMAVHVPLSLKAQSEARVLLLASNNWISCANASPVMTLTQDMVLGSYFLTIENLSLYYLIRKVRFFKDIDSTLRAYSFNNIELHCFVWIKFNTHSSFFLRRKNQVSLGISSSNTIYNKRNFTDFSPFYFRTTVGRLLFNQAIKEFL